MEQELEPNASSPRRFPNQDAATVRLQVCSSRSVSLGILFAQLLQDLHITDKTVVRALSWGKRCGFEPPQAEGWVLYLAVFHPG